MDKYNEQIFLSWLKSDKRYRTSSFFRIAMPLDIMRGEYLVNFSVPKFLYRKNYQITKYAPKKMSLPPFIPSSLNPAPSLVPPGFKFLLPSFLDFWTQKRIDNVTALRFPILFEVLKSTALHLIASAIFPVRPLGKRKVFSPGEKLWISFILLLIHKRTAVPNGRLPIFFFFFL